MSLRHALLGLLASEPGSGYDLLKRFEGSLAFVWPATQSQLYTELGKMADGGLIEVVSEGPRGRKDYDITKDGRAELERWLTETEPDRTIRDETVLRTFFMWAVDAERAKAFFEREAELTRRYAEQLQHVADAFDFTINRPEWFGRIALENGLRISSAYLGWAEWAAEHVDEPTRDESGSKGRRARAS
jgi:DNA-binding PadR family transcriptional regulator